MTIKYLTPEKIEEYNLLALSLIKVKKADKSEVLSKTKLRATIEACENLEGDIYDKAICLLKGLIQKTSFCKWE